MTNAYGLALAKAEKRRTKKVKEELGQEGAYSQWLPHLFLTVFGVSP